MLFQEQTTKLFLETFTIDFIESKIMGFDDFIQIHKRNFRYCPRITFEAVPEAMLGGIAKTKWPSSRDPNPLLHQRTSNTV